MKTEKTKQRFYAYATMTALMLAMIVTVPACSPVYNTSLDLAPDLVPVTAITGVPETTEVGTDLALGGLVAPDTATNTAIVWTVKDAGGTGAAITGDSLSTVTAGTVVVTATITNGKSAFDDYTQDFTITVTGGDVDAEGTEGEGAEGIEGEGAEGAGEGAEGAGEGVEGTEDSSDDPGLGALTAKV